MKESRDRAYDWGKNPTAKSMIVRTLEMVKSLGANCVSVSTPYDEQFIPILTLWVGEARRMGLSVWFRGNFSGWEGWFDYPKFSDIGEHHKKTYELITKHQQLFENGDIFTPAPEPENGVIGDPRSTGENEKFLKFMTDSFDNCIAAFAQIKKQVNCGYFSTNGDVAAQILNKETVEKLGNIVVIDHYVDDSERFGSDILTLHKNLNAKVAVGEFGAPIPDIHGTMTEDDQAKFVQKLFDKLYEYREFIPAVNYWVLSGGTTAIIDEKGNMRKAAQVVRNYYKQATVVGNVQNTLGESLGNSRVAIGEKIAQLTTDNSGDFTAIVPGGSHRITVENDSYGVATELLEIPAGDTASLKITLVPKEAFLIYRLRALLAELLTQITHKVSL